VRDPDRNAETEETRPPPLTRRVAPLNYRAGGPVSKSQWWTDDQAYGACLVYALLGLTALASLVGAIVWLVSQVWGF